MFVGREAELATLDRLYRKKGFQMVVIYGRRRVGKTTLIDRFVHGKPTLYFTAQQKSSLQNLALFSQAVYELFGIPSETGAFASWDAALRFVAQQAKQAPMPLIFVFDEFPYAAEADPALPSALQVAIDHEFKGTDATMILCGSNEGFMESDVLERKSPLYGRRTAQMKLRPLDYLDAARMIPKASTLDLVRYYATFGGTPYYVEQIDDERSYEENVADLLFDISGLLYEEPLMLLRQELREPALYNSILDALGTGATKPKEIAEKAGVDRASMSKYLRTLEGLGLVRKELPFGDNPLTSRKGLYKLADPLFSYWYRFVSASIGAIENGAGATIAATKASGSNLATYVGMQFEAISCQWVARQSAAGKLPFIATAFGKWWGSDPLGKCEADIDVIAACKEEGQLLAGECKWREEFDESAALATLERRAALIKGYDQVTYALFAKHPFSPSTRRKARERHDVLLVDADELYASA